MWGREGSCDVPMATPPYLHYSQVFRVGGTSVSNHFNESRKKRSVSIKFIVGEVYKTLPVPPQSMMLLGVSTL